MKLNRKSTLIRNLELINDYLHLDLRRIHRTRVIALPIRSYLWIVFYFLHSLRYLTFMNANSNVRSYLGDHMQYFPPPATLWYVLLLVPNVCNLIAQGSFLIAIRTERQAALYFVELLFQIHSREDSSQMDITTEDFEHLSRRLRLGLDFLNIATAFTSSAMLTLQVYGLIGGNCLSLLSILWVLADVHLAHNYCRKVGCYLLNLDLICILSNMRLRKLMSRLEVGWTDVNIEIVKQFSNLDLINSIVRNQILVYITGFVPIVGLVLTPALWRGNWLTKVSTVTAVTIGASFLAYIIYRTAAIKNIVPQLYLRLSRFAVQWEISFADKYRIWRLMAQFKRTNYFGLSCGGLFVMDKLVFLKVFLAVARFSILFHKITIILR